MATYRVRREITTTSEGVVIADNVEEATAKLMSGEWEYGRTETTEDKVVSCEEIIIAEITVPED